MLGRLVEALARVMAILGGLVLVTSEGFTGSYAGTRFGRSVSVIAGEGTMMERDYEFDSRLYFADLDSPESIGRSAGNRVVRRVNPRKVDTASGITVILDPRVARGFVGHLAGAIIADHFIFQQVSCLLSPGLETPCQICGRYRWQASCS